MNIAVVLFAAALSAGNIEFDATAREGARGISISRAAAELRENGPAPGSLAKAMLADPAKFEKPAEAERLCRGLFAEEVRSQFAAKVLAIDERLGIASNRAESASSGAEMDAAKVEEIVNRRFGGAFAAERKSAVESQAKTIVAATRPTEEEFDAKEDWELREQMLARIVGEQKAVVFSENRQFISERMVEPVIQDARREQKRQSEYLMRARCDTASPSKLAADLRDRLEENVRERREKAADPSKAWGVFAGIFGKSVGPAVERRTLDRLEKKMDAIAIDVEADAILKEISETPERHVKAADSEKIFAERYAASVLARALDGTCEDAPQAERDELRAYLAERLGGERLRRAAEAKVKKDVLPKWREARTVAAARQAEETWPSLADGTWFPAADVADDVAARSDYEKSVREWRGLAALKPLADAPRGKPLMEEADRRADSAVAAAFDVARSAIAAQNAIVDGNHAKVLAEARRRKDSFWTRTPDLKTVVGLLTQATEEAWDATRLDTLWPGDANRPANAADQHKALFPSVRRKIELIAKSILEEMNEPQPENEKKPEEPPPEEPQPDETPEEPPEEVIEFAISVRRAGEEVEVSLKQGETVVESATVPAKKDDFENAMHKVTTAMSRILGLK